MFYCPPPFSYTGKNSSASPHLELLAHAYIYKTRNSAQCNCSAKSLAASVMSSILPTPPYLPPVILYTGRGSGHRGVWLQGGLGGGGGWGRGRGLGGGGGGRGYFIHPAIYCTTTWCFALKGLRTTTQATRSRPEAFYPRAWRLVQKDLQSAHHLSRPDWPEPFHRRQANALSEQGVSNALTFSLAPGQMLHKSYELFLLRTAK